MTAVSKRTPRPKCPRPWTGSTPGDAICALCGEPWHTHARAGMAEQLTGCGARGHWTAGGPPWVDGGTYYCGACGDGDPDTKDETP